MSNPLIGFIGQGWIGKHYADDFEQRGHNVIRYALEKPYLANGEKIKECDIVFIAVPTPTTPDGFDDSILREAIKKVGSGKTVIIKSTLLPGTTEALQEETPDIFVMHSPEFLRETSAAYDSSNPKRNIIGIPIDNEDYRQRAKTVLEVLPKAPFEMVCKAHEAELIKYGGNCWLYTKVVFMNMLHDLALKMGGDWNTIIEAMMADKRIGDSHMNVSHKGGRGAGGHCFPKDFAAYLSLYEKLLADDKHGQAVLKSLQDKNNELMVKSDKDESLLLDIFGKEFLSKYK